MNALQAGATEDEARERTVAEFFGQMSQNAMDVIEYGVRQLFHKASDFIDRLDSDRKGEIGDEFRIYGKGAPKGPKDIPYRSGPKSKYDYETADGSGPKGGGYCSGPNSARQKNGYTTNG